MPNAFHLLNAGQMQLYHQNSLNSPSTPTQLTANAPTGSASAAAAALAATLGNLGNLGNLNQLSQLAASNSLLPITSLSNTFNSTSNVSSVPFNLSSFTSAGLQSPLAMAAAAAPMSPDYQQTSINGDSKRILQSLTAGLAGQLSALAAQQSFQQALTRSNNPVSSTSTCTSPSTSVVESLPSDHFSANHKLQSSINNNNNNVNMNGTCSSPSVEDSSRSLNRNAASSLLTAATAPNLGLLNELLAFYDVRKMYENLPYLNALYPALFAANNNNNNNLSNQQQSTRSPNTHNLKSTNADTPLDLSMALKDDEMNAVHEASEDNDEDDDEAMDDLSEADRLALNAEEHEPINSAQSNSNHTTSRKSHKASLDRSDSCGESVPLDHSLSSKSSCSSAPAHFGRSNALSALHSPPDSPLSSSVVAQATTNGSAASCDESQAMNLSPLLVNGHSLLNSHFTAQLSQQQQQQLLSTLSAAAAAAAAAASQLNQHHHHHHQQQQQHNQSANDSNGSISNGLNNSVNSPLGSQRTSPVGSPRAASPSNTTSSLYNSFNLDRSRVKCESGSDAPIDLPSPQVSSQHSTPHQLNQLSLSLKNELLQTLQRLRSLNGDEKSNPINALGNGLLSLANSQSSHQHGTNNSNNSSNSTNRSSPAQQLTLNGNVKLTLDAHCDTLAALQTAAAVVAAKKVLVVDDPIASAVCGKTTILKKPRVRTMLPCEYCGKAFDRPSLLRRHLRTHTGEKPHVCDVCGKGFSTSSSLNTHRRIHSGEKPHQCNVCGKRFTASSNLYYHRMTHNKEKPHKCTLCSKSFPTPGDLKSHMYVHNGSWPFKCQICNRGFSKQTNLRNHMYLHTGK